MAMDHRAYTYFHLLAQTNTLPLSSAHTGRERDDNASPISLRFHDAEFNLVMAFLLKKRKMIFSHDISGDYRKVKRAVGDGKKVTVKIAKSQTVTIRPTNGSLPWQ